MYPVENLSDLNGFFLNFMGYWYNRYACVFLIYMLACKAFVVLLNACLGHGLSLYTTGSYSISKGSVSSAVERKVYMDARRK